MYKKRCYDSYFIIANRERCSVRELLDITIIKETILDYFEMLELDFDYERKFIYKNKLKYPHFEAKNIDKKVKFDYINISVKSYIYWCKTIYQLSNQITHCFINMHNNKQDRIPWVEEVISHTISLYILKYFYKNWKKCELNKFNANYGTYIIEYLDDLLDEEGNNKLSECKNIKELMEINIYIYTKEKNYFNESTKLYNLISEKDIKSLINYRDFVKKDTILLDTKKYLEEYPDSKAIRYICEIQDNIIEKENV